MGIADRIRGPLAGACLWLLPLAAGAESPALNGSWSAEAEVNGAKIPFRLDLQSTGGAASGTFFDGLRPANPSKDGRFDGTHLHLAFPSYAAVIDAEVTGDRLDGAYVAPGRTVKITATRGWTPPARDAEAPRIAGEWIIPTVSPKGETAWRLIIHQRGGETEAAILRIDGDTGTLNGGFKEGAYHLSHFAGERAARLDITPLADKTLKLVLVDGSGEKDLTALRPEAAAKLGAAPTDPTRHTRVADASEPLNFSFPDLDGRTVSNTDPRFKGKVLVIDVMGSWCPNCHDEAPFLQALYARHHREGLEVVALDFEQADQLADPQRLKAFIQRYGLTYTVLLAGQPKEVNEKLPQAVNLNAWPTTFFVGRDGRVKAVHVGFTSPGSGRRDIETRDAVEREVEGLLRGGPRARSAASSAASGL